MSARADGFSLTLGEYVNVCQAADSRVTRHAVEFARSAQSFRRCIDLADGVGVLEAFDILTDESRPDYLEARLAWYELVAARSELVTA